MKTPVHLNSIAFKEFLKNYPKLTEAPIAYRGDYNFKLAVDAITDTGINLKWNLRGKIQTHKGFLDVYKHKTLNNYIVGEFSPRYDDSEGLYFNIYCELYIREDKVKGKIYHAVETVKVKDENESRGVATELYKFLVKQENLSLISDGEQFFGARRLWQKLSKHFNVDVIDINTGKILKKNIKLKKELVDGSFDKEFWSDGDGIKPDYSKVNIRFILRDL